jgi:hypothetical protein
MTVEVRPAEGKGGLQRFWRVPFQLYRGDPKWVPPLWADYRHLFSPDNPFLKHAVIRPFLAWRGDRAVGSIAYVQDENHVRFHGEKAGFWGFFECADDPEAAGALFDRVEAEGRAAGMEKLLGPMNPSTNDSCGLLVEGFDEPPVVMMPYNPPRYAALIEANGYGKAKDLYAYTAPVTDKSLTRLERIARMAYAKAPITVRPVNLKKLEEELVPVMDIYNAAWEKNWGFVPLTEEEIRDLAKRLKPILVPDLVQVAFVDGDPAAFIMTLPDANEALIKIRGRLDPWSLAKLLYWSKRIRGLRLVTLGVKAQYRVMGLDACLYYESLKRALPMHYHRVEVSWILEDNTIMQKAVRLLDGRLYKVYRIYEKSL